MTWSRWRAALVCTLIAVPLLAACGEPEDDEDRLLRAISRTDRLAYVFVYEDKRPATGGGSDVAIQLGGQEQVIEAGPENFAETRVQGVVEDDFRFKAQLAVAGRPTLEKIVSDDTAAVRFLDPSQLNRFVDREVADSVKTDTDRPGISVGEALQSGRWVLDPEGAPQQLLGLNADREQGIDPVLDALTTFAHVRAAVDKAQNVELYSEDSLDPAYRTSEDPFPAPDEDSDVIRYDLRRPKLPSVGSIGASGQPDVAETEHFRKMAIYVNDAGQVIQVLEEVEITGSQVEEFRTYFNAFLEDVFSQEDAGGGQFVEAFRKQQEAILKQGGEAALGEFLLAAWSAGASQSGGETIDIRSLRLDLQGLGDVNSVDLPTDDVVTGNLAILVGTGQKPTEAEADAAATPPGATPPGAAPPGAGG